jgi:tellurite resistance protein TehA-like permease
MKTKNFIRPAIITILILSIPALAMQLSSNVDWGIFDFAIIGTLIFSASLAFEVISKKLTNITHKTIVGFILLVLVFLIWAELAVNLVSKIISGELLSRFF